MGDTADELVEETTSQTLDNNDNGDDNAAIKDTSDELVEEKTSETLDAVKNDDAKEPISKNAARKIRRKKKRIARRPNLKHTLSILRQQPMNPQQPRRLQHRNRRKKPNLSVSWQQPKLLPRRP